MFCHPEVPRTLYFKAFFGTWDTILGVLDGPWTALWRLMVPLSRKDATLSQSGWKECPIWDILGTSFRSQGRQKSLEYKKNMHPKNVQKRNWFPTHPQVAQSGSNTEIPYVLKGPTKSVWVALGSLWALVGALFGVTFSWFLGQGGIQNRGHFYAAQKSVKKSGIPHQS